MKLIAVTTLLLGSIAGAVFAQGAAEMGAERQRIDGERARANAQFTAQQKACYQKFAVTDCLEDASKAHRRVMDDLRRQDTALNDAGRKQRTADRLRELEKKEAEQQKRLQEAGVKAAQQKEREQRTPPVAKPGQTERVAAEPKTPMPRPVREKKPVEAPDVQENRRRWDARAADAQDHKAKVEQRNAQSKKQVQPLPVPP